MFENFLGGKSGKWTLNWKNKTKKKKTRQINRRGEGNQMTGRDSRQGSDIIHSRPPFGGSAIMPESDVFCILCSVVLHTARLGKEDLFVCFRLLLLLPDANNNFAPFS